MSSQALIDEQENLTLVQTISTKRKGKLEMFSQSGGKPRTDNEVFANLSTEPSFFNFKLAGSTQEIKISNTARTISGFTPESIRASNRELTRQTLVKEQSRFIEERRRLVEKKYEEGLSASEERHLKYIDWQLDRIEDADVGEQFDQLERLVQAHEALARKIGHYAERIEASIKVSKHRGGRKN